MPIGEAWFTKFQRRARALLGTGPETIHNTLIKRILEARSFLRGGRKGVALREREGGEEGRKKGKETGG